MTAPVFPALGASTVHRKWIFQVNTGTTGSPIWKTIGATNNTGFNPDGANLEDDSDMQSGGAGSQTKTAGSASATLSILRKTKASDPTSYDDAQEFLRLKAIGQYGPANSVQLRIFEWQPGTTPRVEAYMGFFAVGWENQAESNTGLSNVQLTFAGQGACAPISHPYPLVAAAPVITSIAPTTAAASGGTLLHIYGSGFTGATAVTFGGTAATNFSVESDSLIIATAPAKAAGTVAVVVTTPAGASTGNTLTFA